MTNADKKDKKQPHPIDVHVGGRVRLRRMMAGISQDGLGESLGLTFQQIQKYEKGINRIGASRLFQISRALNVPVQFFYDDYDGAMASPHGFAESAEPPPEDLRSEVMRLLSSPEDVRLCQAFSKIRDPQIRRRILDLVISLSGEDVSTA